MAVRHTSRDTHDTGKRIELRRRAARRSPADQGADEATLAALDEAAGGTPGVPGPQGEAPFASGEWLLGAHTMAAPPQTDHAVLSPVPDPLPLVIDRDGSTLHITRVRAGREAQASYHRRRVNLGSENTGQVADDLRAAASEADAGRAPAPCGRPR